MIVWRMRAVKLKCDLVYAIKQSPETVCVWLAWRLPKRLALWAFVRVATFNEPGNPADTTCGVALDRWVKDAKL